MEEELIRGFFEFLFVKKGIHTIKIDSKSGIFPSLSPEVKKLLEEYLKNKK